LSSLGYTVGSTDAAPLRVKYFNEQFEALRRCNCKDAGLPPLTGQVWRIESQERGNLLLFLPENLDEAALDKLTAAQFPPLGTAAF
jgi:hypothetical protein